MGRLTWRIRDYSDEMTFGGVNIADLGAIDPWSNAENDGSGLNVHLEAHSIGTVVAVNYTQETVAEDDTRPASSWAQRELAFRVHMTDSVNFQKSYFTVGCADLTIGSVVAGSDELDLTASPTAAFVSFIESDFLSADGNAVTVDRIVIVGRSS